MILRHDGSCQPLAGFREMHTPIDMRLVVHGAGRLDSLDHVELQSASGSNRDYDLLEMVSIVVEVVGEESAVFRDMPRWSPS